MAAVYACRGMLECEGIFFTGATKPLRGMVRCGVTYIYIYIA